MRRSRIGAIVAAAAFLASGSAAAQRPDSLSAAVRSVLRVSTPRVILEHVNVIDGTGAAAVADRNITIENGRITAIAAGKDEPASEGTTVLDLRGRAVMPGIVGMHDHLFYLAFPGLGPDGNFERPTTFVQQSFSAPRLALANGVTTMRTAGSIEPYTDLKLKQSIEAGAVPGPHLDVTGPYLDGPGNANLVFRALTGPDDARETVAYWAARGVTSFKAYKYITRAELGAAIAEAHKHGIKVTGHLCSVTYDEAIELGIDNIEHGFEANTALDPGKAPDTCSAAQGDSTLARMTPQSAEGKALIALLLQHHVAITSTLPSLASVLVPPADGRPEVRAAVLDAMSPSLRTQYLYLRNRPATAATQAGAALLLQRDMDLQRAFVAAGGLLIAGPDPGGPRALLPGFSDQREIELLVAAGFTPVEAIRIATLNGATYLGRADRIGSIAVGKNADLVVMKGDPSVRIADVENVELVFKDGLGYDTAKLLESVKGRYGEY